MNRVSIARELIRAAKSVLAEWEYWDGPARPTGKGWEPPPQGKKVKYRFRRQVGAPGEEPQKKEPAPADKKKGKQVQNNDSVGEKTLIRDFEPKVKELFGDTVKIFGDAYSKEDSPEAAKRRKDANDWFKFNGEPLNKLSVFSKSEMVRLERRLEKIAPGTVKRIKEASFKPDMVIEKKENSRLPFTVVVESDGKQHENQRTDEHGFSHVFLDRAKEQIVREKKKTLSIRLRSDAHTGKQASFILEKVLQYNNSIGEGCVQKRRRQMLQEYIDAMCFEFASERNREADSLKIDTSPEAYVEMVKKKVVGKVKANKSRKRGLSDTQVKLLNIQVTNRRLLKGIFSIWNLPENSKKGNNDKELHFDGGPDTSFGFVTDIMRRCRRLKTKRERRASPPSGA